MHTQPPLPTKAHLDQSGKKNNDDKQNAKPDAEQGLFAAALKQFEEREKGKYYCD